MSDIVVRFAPSPTGGFHVGGARTALYNWLYARKNGGKFLLRIEDTDQKRYKENAVTELIQSLTWLGIDWDFGPTTQELIELGVDNSMAKRYGKGAEQNSFVQSKRNEIYQSYVIMLIENDMAYRVFSDEADEDIDKDDFAVASKEMKLNIWREASPFMIRKALQAGRPYHVRLKMPREDDIVCNDYLRGDIRFKFHREKDFVIQKTDGGTTYHLASVIDDHLMGTTHVIRGEEWLSSLPKHYYLYECFGWTPPTFIHTASILNPSGKGKMSKRDVVAKDGKTKVPTFVMDYKRKGFLPEALINFMSLTGWNPKNGVEFMSKEDLIGLFNLDGLSVRGATWDYNKLLHFNKQWMRTVSETNMDLFMSHLNEYKEINNVNNY